ncbi:MAG: cell division protein ZapA [Candidatus Rokubacteria bacterium]|nr:cell division protein ZapA [Candidatus Rokubacteria bacterium]
MSEPKRVELNLLGQTLTVRTEASPEYVRSLAAYLEDRVAALRRGGVKDPTAALALAALDITDELFRARDDRVRQDGDMRARLGALLTLLEKVTPREPTRS